jgi:hypothetical protein
MQNIKQFLTGSDHSIPIDNDYPEYLNNLIHQIHDENLANMDKVGLFDNEGTADITLIMDIINERPVTLFDEKLGEGFAEKFINVIDSWGTDRNTHELWANVSLNVADFQMALTSITVLRYCLLAIGLEQDNIPLETRLMNATKCISRARALLGYFDQLNSTFHLCLYFNRKYESKYKSVKLPMTARWKFSREIVHIVCDQELSAAKAKEAIADLYDKDTSDPEIMEWVVTTLLEKNNSEVKRDILEPIRAANSLFN